MLAYIIRRIWLFFPTLIVISLAIFWLYVNAPYDPAEDELKQEEGEVTFMDRVGYEREYDRIRRKFDLDIPSFYISLNSLSETDTLYKIRGKKYRQTLSRLSYRCGDWTRVAEYKSNLEALEGDLYRMSVDSLTRKPLALLKDHVRDLKKYHDYENLSAVIGKIEERVTLDSAVMGLTPRHESLSTSFENMRSTGAWWNNYIPKLTWNGRNNRYHNWMGGFIFFDFGDSYRGGTVNSYFKGKFQPTLTLSLISLVITFVLSIFLGVISAMYKGRWPDYMISGILFVLYSLPSFWVAIVLVFYFANPNYLHWFPTYGLGDDYNLSWWQAPFLNWNHYILPLICWTYGGLAILTRQVRRSMVQTLNQDFIRTAKAKGLSVWRVAFKHALRNSLIPIITIFGSALPLLIAGSIVLEEIFTIGGMGQLLYRSVAGNPDFPVVFTIIMLMAFVTMLSYLIVDLLYVWADPRVKLTKKQ